MSVKPKVVIIGGGVAGLTAAHELKIRNYDVMVLERQPDFGGKARSALVPTTYSNADIVGFPTEHGFRFFPGFYRHLPRTLAQIPCGHGKFVINNLVTVKQAAYAREGQPYFRIPTKNPDNIRELARTLRRFFSNPGLGLTAGETAIAVVKLLRAMSACNERREAEMDQIPWWDYMQADEMSEAYRNAVVNGLTQNFVAMDAKKSSTKSVINILCRLLNDLITPGDTMDRVLNGPTSEVWIEPWRQYLKRDISNQGHVDLCNGRKVRSLHFNARTNRITGLSMNSGPDLELPDAVYIAAAPIESMIQIVKNSDTVLLEHSPSLKLLLDPVLQINWMSGIQYYLREEETMFPGHIVYLNSNWALTSISQNQFWKKKIDQYGSGKIKGVVSVIISDWFMAGNGGKWPGTASEADSAEQIAAETLAEIRANISRNRGVDLNPNNIAGHYLDPAIVFKADPRTELRGLMPAVQFVDRLGRGPFAVADNQEPLFINTVNSWACRPTEITGISNLFLAADYIKTNTDLATMEGANEAARRAVNAVLDVTGSHRRRCEIFEFDEPLPLAPWKALDHWFYERGIPNPGVAIDRLFS